MSRNVPELGDADVTPLPAARRHGRLAFRRREETAAGEPTSVPAWIARALGASRTVLCFLAFLGFLAWMSSMPDGMDVRADSLAMWASVGLGMVAGKSAAEHLAKARAGRGW